MTAVSKETTLASSFTRPDSSCPTPPQSRQLTSSLSSSSASLSPSDASEISAASGYSGKSCQREVLPKNEYDDADNSNDRGELSTTNDDSGSTLAKDLMLPPRRKRIGRRKSQTYRQLSPNGVEKVITTPTLSCRSVLQSLFTTKNPNTKANYMIV